MRHGLIACCAFFSSIFVFAALSPAQMVVPPLHAQLVTASSGWATYNGRLLWTDNEGVSWKDITPPLDSAESISSVFFRASVAWVTITQRVDGNPSFVFLASTSDGGQTWQKGPVNAASRFLSLGPQTWAGNSYMFFLDPMNGWMELQAMTSSNFKYGILLATKDGGRSWSELPEPPTVDRMTWISPNVGWIAGGVSQGDLFATRDGGLTWQKQTPPVPNGTSDPFGRALPPRFIDPQHGTFVVTYQGLKVDESKALIAVYRTSDSGKTWFRTDLLEVSSSDTSVGIAEDGTPVRANLSKGKIITSGVATSNSAQAPIPSTWPFAQVSEVSFIDAETGFLIVYGRECDTAGTNCADIWRLLFTKNAGTSVLDVTPLQSLNAAPAGAANAAGNAPQLLTAPPSVIQGFDISSAPTLQQMQLYLKPARFSVVGIYLGGGNRSDKVQANLNSSWTFFANCMGFTFAPIWVGPQAPGVTCSTCSKLSYTGMSPSQVATDISNAYQAGVSQGESAASVVTNNYGWTDGGIVYYDMEGYNGARNDSSALVNNFIGGWVDGPRGRNGVSRRT